MWPHVYFDLSRFMTIVNDKPSQLGSISEKGNSKNFATFLALGGFLCVSCPPFFVAQRSRCWGELLVSVPFGSEEGVRENSWGFSDAWEGGRLYQTQPSLNPSLEAQMRITIAFALLNIVTGELYRKQEDRVNSFVRNSGRIQERNKRAVLTPREEMMVREEIFLESLASKLARRENAIAVDTSSEWVPKMKSFLKTFRERPRLQTKGMC